MKKSYFDYFNEIIKFDPVNHYIVYTKDDLLEMKKNLSLDKINHLEQKLSYMLNLPFLSVTSKPDILRSGFDIHDYISLATYYWPNENIKDGLPYVSKDGYSNPEGEKYDKDKLRSIAFNVYYLALLYYLTENKVYYNKMKEFIEVFFINEDTKMNPNMNHAQMIKGVNDGRGIGIIDFTANFSYSLTLLTSLYELGLLTNDLYIPFSNWCKSFLSWVLTSKNGVEEFNAKNNHGTLYTFGVLCLADFIKNEETIMSFKNQVAERMSAQMVDDGSLPLELARTKSKSYSLMGYKGFIDCAIILNKYNINLFNVDFINNNDEVVNLKKGIDYLLKHLVITNDWQYEQVVKFDYATLIPIIYYSNKYFKSNLGLIDNISIKEIIDDLQYVLLCD